MLHKKKPGGGEVRKAPIRCTKITRGAAEEKKKRAHSLRGSRGEKRGVTYRGVKHNKEARPNKRENLATSERGPESQVLTLDESSEGGFGKQVQSSKSSGPLLDSCRIVTGGRRGKMKCRGTIMAGSRRSRPGITFLEVGGQKALTCDGGVTGSGDIS